MVERTPIEVVMMGEYPVGEGCVKDVGTPRKPNEPSD